MGFVVFLLIVALIWLWSTLNTLSVRSAKLREQFAAADVQIGELSQRVLRLERGTAGPSVAPMPASISATVPAPAFAPVPVAAPPVVTPPAVVTAPAVLPTPVVAAPPVLAPTPAWSDPATETAAAAPVAAASAESWEMTVGTSWLNKIGVLVFIMGVALLVGYSFNHVGPAGRVAIGFALSFGMLAGGVVLEKQTTFRNYAYGLVAGGWAGVYFTTFAMHDVPAARIIDNDLLAVSLLSMVAAGMIAHSLRYRSQIVTSLAFVVAYTTLALSPVSGFSLAASVPLAVSLLVVSQRLGWAGVSALGIVATYGAFALRGAIFPDVMDPHSPLPYVMLATYWLAFEAADITGLRSRAGQTLVGPVPVPMLALNATGFMGALLLTVPRSNPGWLSLLLFGAASAYVASAVIRARLLPGWGARHAKDEPFDTTHGATAIAAVLFAIAIDLRFGGDRETLALLLLAQLLVTAGLTLGDTWLRRMGSVGIAVAAVYALDPGGEPATSALVSNWPITSTSAVILLIASACYGNREALHRRHAQPVWVESVFTWIAAALVSSVLMRELDPAHQAIAGLAVAALLLEAGFRRSREYVYQSYVMGGFASYGLIAAFVAPPTASGMLATWGVAPTPLDEWTVLPTGILLTAVAAWRLTTYARRDAVPGWRAAAGASTVVCTALLLLFEWRVLPTHAVAPAWMLTAVALIAAGSSRRLAILRWQAYVVSLGATLRAIGPLLNGAPESTLQTIAIGVVIATVYVVAYLGRRALPVQTTTPGIGTTDSLEDAIASALSVVATASLAVFKWRVLPDELVAPAWTLTGVVLMAMGIWRRTVDLRWQGYALIALGAVRMGNQVFSTTDPAGSAIAWLTVIIGVLYLCGVVVRRLARGAEPGGEFNSAEDIMGAVQLLLATGMLAMLILQEVRPSMVTLALGLQGLGLMFAGLIVRERVMRLSGLGLLLGCILKLFVYDLREREAIERIMSFVILGLFLLAISWTYTRYREQIRKFL